MAKPTTTYLDSKTGQEFPASRRDQFLEKPLPSSEESEKVVIGAILLDNRLIVEAATVLTPEDFYNPLNRRIFAAMLVLHHRSAAIDPILIGEELKKEGSFESVGGITTITNITFGMPHFSEIASYIAIVKDKANLREIVRNCNAIIGDALSEEYESIDVRASAVTLLNVVGDAKASAPHTAAEVWERVQENFRDWIEDKRPTGVPTGIPELDACLRYGGCAKGDLIFIAARPSIGKSALMLQLARNAGMLGITTDVFTLEMSERDLFMRTLPPVAGVKNFSINPLTVRRNDEARDRLYQAGEYISKLPIYFDDSAFKLDRLLARAEYAITRLGVRYILVDYLQLMKANVTGRRRDQEFEEISGELKQLALRHHIPVVCLAQLSRGNAKEDRRPEMDDIREAGSAEQDADLVILPYREIPRKKKLGARRSVEDIVDEETEADSSTVKIQLYIAKQRNGKANIEIPVDFDMDYQRFMSAALWRDDRLRVME